MSASILPEAGGDRLVMKLASRLGTFRTQAASGAGGPQLAYLKVWVSGPGITTPIENSGGFISIAGGTASINIPGIPQGNNRIITAQFYDSNQVAITAAVAKGVYSSGGSGAIPVTVRRRFVPMAQVLEKLLSGPTPALAASLDAAALQTEIEKILFNNGPVSSTFNVDPALINTTQLTDDLAMANGVVANVASALQGGTYTQTVGSLRLEISGLLSTNTVTVRVGDTTSIPVTSGNGTVSIPDVAPGDWPVYIHVSSDFPYPHSGFGGAQNSPPAIYSLRERSAPTLTDQSFDAGVELNLGTYTLRPDAPTLSSLSANLIRTGAQFSINGQNFFPDTALNTVRILNMPGHSNIASIQSATLSELVVDIPSAVPGQYQVQVSTAGNISPITLPLELSSRWYVKPDGDPNADGMNWAQATTLQHALEQAGRDSEIWLKQGVYKPHASDRDVSFRLENVNISLLGGFTGSETLSSERSPDASLTVLSGDLGTPDDPNSLDPAHPSRADNSKTVFKTPAFIAGTRLDGLTITGGNGTNGAGLHAGDYTLNLTLNNVIFHHNTATGNGGGLFFTTSNGSDYPTFTDVVFRDNAAAKGGGVYQHHLQNGGRSTLTRTRFERNKAGEGGGYYSAQAADMEIKNSVFHQNEASSKGGGVYLDLTSVSAGDRIYNTLFSENAAIQGGAAYLIHSSGVTNAFTMGHVTLANNRINTLESSGSPCGAGLYVDNQNLVLKNALIWSNETHPLQASMGGRGKYSACDVNGASLNFDASIIDGKGDGLNYSPAEGSDTVISSDPLFMNLAQPAGPDGSFGNNNDGLRLQAGSPAINLGIAYGQNTDILGQVRQGLPDAGAYEFSP